MAIFLVISSLFLINIVFGYWRSDTRRFSVQWILAIHVPVLLGMLLRLALLGWNWFLVPAFIAEFAAGQYIGGKTREFTARYPGFQPGSFLLSDLAKIWSARRRRSLIVKS